MKLYYIGTTEDYGGYWIIMASSPQEAFEKWYPEYWVLYSEDPLLLAQTYSLENLPKDFKIEEIPTGIYYGEWS